MSVFGERPRRALWMRVVVILRMRFRVVSVAFGVVCPLQELTGARQQFADDVMPGLAQDAPAFDNVGRG